MSGTCGGSRVDVCELLNRIGRLAQMVERPLRMREVGGSIPPMSNSFPHTHNHLLRATSSVHRHLLLVRPRFMLASFATCRTHIHRTVQRMACHYVIVPTYKYSKSGWISLGTIKTTVDAKPTTK